MALFANEILYLLKLNHIFSVLSNNPYPNIFAKS